MSSAASATDGISAIKTKATSHFIAFSINADSHSISTPLACVARDVRGCRFLCHRGLRHAAPAARAHADGGAEGCARQRARENRRTFAPGARAQRISSDAARKLRTRREVAAREARQALARRAVLPHPERHDGPVADAQLARRGLARRARSPPCR